MVKRLALVIALLASPPLAGADSVADHKRVLAKQPHDVIAFAELVAAHRSAGTYERLVAEYRGMPADWATLVVLGRLEQNAGRPGDAIARWTAAVALRDDDAASWTLLGGAHRFGGDAAKARAAYDKAIAHTPHVPKKLTLLRAAIELATAANDDAALDRYHDAYRALGASDARVWQARGERLMTKRRFAAAHDAYALAEAGLGMTSQGRVAAILGRSSALEALGRDRDAADACWNGFATTPEGWLVERDLVVRLVEIHRRMGTLPALLAQLDKHWSDAKRRHFEWDVLGKLHDELGSTTEAIDALSRAAALVPSAYDTQRRLIDLLDAAGRPAEALRRLELAAQTFEPRFAYDLADRHWKTGDHPLALETARLTTVRYGSYRPALELIWQLYVAWNERALADALRARIDAR